MNLNSILDQAWTFLEESLKQKQANAKLENERLTQLGLEQEKTKRMNMSSQEKIQSLMNKGLLDKQELVNSGALSLQDLQNSGLLDKAELEGKNKLDERKMMNTGALDVENTRGGFENERALLKSNTDLGVERSRRQGVRDSSNSVLKEYGSDGVVIGEKIGNPYTNAIGSPGPEEIDNETQFNSTYSPKKTAPLTQPSGSLSALGRHTVERSLPATPNNPGMPIPAIGKPPMTGSYEDEERKRRQLTQPQRRIF